MTSVVHLIIQIASPTPPEITADSFEVIRDDDLTKEISQCDRDTMYRRLQSDLLAQIQLCARNQQMFAQMEGINHGQLAQQYKSLEQQSAQDLEKLRQGFQRGSKTPVFHYETRSLITIHVNNDLTDNDLEVRTVLSII
jgi:paraquat-inducible protein B